MVDNRYSDTHAARLPNVAPELRCGERWRIHPASDWFMKGIKYGTVTAIGTKWVHMESDQGHRFRIHRHAFVFHVYPQVPTS